MKRDPRTILLTLWRCLKLQCPVCGGASIVQRPFHTKKSCTACGVIFKREEGFFVGAIMANVVATEVLILLVYFASLLLTNFDEQTTLSILFVIGVAFAHGFCQHRGGLWLRMKKFIEGMARGRE